MNFKIIARQIIMDNINSTDLLDINDLVFPKLNFRGKSEAFKKQFVASQLAGMTLVARDKWVRHLYGTTHRLQLLTETLLNKQRIRCI